MLKNDAVLLGLLIVMIAGVMKLSQSENPFWKKFFTFVPSLLLFYFLPSLLSTAGLVDPDKSVLYTVASQYLLPASLVMLTISCDLKGCLRLGPKALTVFLAGSLGVIIGGPLALWAASFLSPEVLSGVGDNAPWKGLATIAGSWIGGGANQTALKEIFKTGDSIFSTMVAMDVIIANLWMAILLYGAGRYQKIDTRMKADNSAIEDLKVKVTEFQEQVTRNPSTLDIVTLLAVGLGVTALSHACADFLAPWFSAHHPELAKLNFSSKFFWIVVISSFAGIALSFTRARNLEGVGASKFGSIFLYFLVATIGLKMNVLSLIDTPIFLFIGAVWILTHALVMLVVAKLTRSPFFFVAVGSQANIGGAASAPIVAAAVHPTLAPVGVLLAVLGYAIGTFGGLLSAYIMQAMASG